MAFLDQYPRDIEERRIPELFARLVPIENMRLGERRGEGPWVDDDAKTLIISSAHCRILGPVFS
jgi:hypothetical protein